MDLALILARQIVVMFLLMSVGFTLKKIGWLSATTVKELNNFLLMVVVSCAVLDSFQGDNSPELLRNFFYAILLSVVANLIGIAVALLIFGKKNMRRRLCVFGASYSNCSFMAFPLLSATFGEQGLLYGAAYVAVFNFLLWSHGVSLFDEQHNLTAKQKVKNVATSPIIITVVVGLAMYTFNLRLPELIGDTVGYIADLNTPFAMILLGVFVARCDLKKLFADRAVFGAVSVKLILMPALVLAFLKVLDLFVSFDSTMVLSILICAGSCTAGTMALMAERYEKDVEFSVKIVTMSTILCLITIPMFVFVARSIM